MRGVLQVKEGLRRPRSEQTFSEDGRIRRETKDKEGDGGTEQGTVYTTTFCCFRRGLKNRRLVTFQVLKEIQSKKEAEMVQKIIAQVKAECEAKGADIERRGYTKHY